MKKNAVFNVLKMVVSLITPMIVLPYISRVLGAEGVGIYSYSASIVSYFLLIGALGISPYAIREGVKLRDNMKKIETFASEIFSVNLLSTIFAYGLFAFLIINNKELADYSLVLIILSIEMFFTTIGKDWLLSIYENFKYPALCSVFTQLLSILLTLLFVKSKNDVYIYTIIVVSAKIITGILYCFRTNEYVKVRFILSPSMKKHIKPIFTLFMFSITAIIYVSSDTTILGYMKGNYLVGIYSGVTKLYIVVKSFIIAILTVMIPRFTLLAHGDKKIYSEVFCKVFRNLMTIILPIAFGIFWESSQIIDIILGKEYLAGNTCLRLLSVSSICSLIGYLFIQCTLIPMKKDKLILIATLIGAGINIVLNLLFIPNWGINAAAATTLISELSVSVLVFLCSRRYIVWMRDKRDMISCFLGVICISVICVISNKFIINPLFQLFVAVLLSIISYSVILLFFKNTVIKEIFTLVVIKKRVM